MDETECSSRRARQWEALANKHFEPTALRLKSDNSGPVKGVENVLVTFDSNVWRLVVSPDCFPKELSKADFDALRKALRDGTIAGALAETVFTLEAIQNADRRSFFAQYRPKVNVDLKEGSGREIKAVVSIGPDPKAHPGNNPYLSTHLHDALSFGFKLLRCPRFAVPKNPCLSDQCYMELTAGIADRFGQLSQVIESWGCGVAHVKKLSAKYSSSSSWFRGLSRVPETEDRALARAIAEWADGDAVAAHFAYGGQYFCTRDQAVRAGCDSVLAQDNRQRLHAQYGINFVSPEDLAAMI